MRPLRLVSQSFVAALALLTLVAPASAQILDLSTAQEISEQALAERLQTADVVLLGELHDNALHHELRGRLIAQFASPGRTIVAEHLPDTGPVNFQSDTRAALEAAGFDAKGWDWPLHQSLYEQIRTSSLPLVGGNLPRDKAREIFMQGVTGLPERLSQTYANSRLGATAQKNLDHDLVEGHCGKLPDRYLSRMRFAQRVTDIAMTHVVLDHHPAVLVAGNGHVRKDYGVPQILSAVAPSLKVISVGFLERSSDSRELINSESGKYDFLWLTDRAARKDPCEEFNLK